MSGKAQDIVGNIYGRLTVLSRAENRNNKPYWVCKCSCENIKIVRGDGLRLGYVVSCGCYRNELGTARICGPGLENGYFKHGHRLKTKTTPTYYSWQAMIARCYNSRLENYRHYGGRGIMVCGRWRVSFENFLDDMGERPEGTTIDRINVDGNYEPGNCRWATISEQNWNKRCHLDSN